MVRKRVHISLTFFGLFVQDFDQLLLSLDALFFHFYQSFLDLCNFVVLLVQEGQEVEGFVRVHLVCL